MTSFLGKSLFRWRWCFALALFVCVWIGSPARPQAHGLLVRQGEAGSHVARLQLDLMQRGYPVGPVDGRFGPRTSAAVRQFQAERGLAVDGIAGPQTQIGLNVLRPPENATLLRYEVREGDSLFRIARRYGLSWEQLEAVDSLRRAQPWLMPGETVYVPVIGSHVLRDKIIVVDPGHGGPRSNGGSVGREGLREKNFNLVTGLRLRDHLEAAGARVVMTRTTDAAPPPDREDGDQLTARAAIARRSGGDLFVSIHANWSEDPTQRGAEVYFHPDSARQQGVADAFGEVLSKATDVPLNGVFADRFKVLDPELNPLPAVLIEAGYLSHAAEERALADRAFQRNFALALLIGALRFFGG